jgi:hypothetical protein
VAGVPLHEANLFWFGLETAFVFVVHDERI